MSKPVPFVMSGDSATILLDGVATPVSRAHVNFDKIVAMLVGGATDDEIRGLINVKLGIALASAGLVELIDNTLYFDGAPLHNAVTSRILDMLRNGINIAPLVAFLDNLMQNPSKRAVDELYGFLEVCNLPVTADGYIIAYKMIREDYTDLYTGTMDNSVGATPKMRRNEVDDAKERTCSQGLHFASLHYVQNGNYGSRDRGNRLVAVKINPRDVVSIPTDYNNSKGRACEYTIIKELDWGTQLPANFIGFDYDDEAEAAADATGEDVVVLTPAGVAHPGATLDANKVYEIKRDLHADFGNMTLTEVSKKHKVSRRHVARIRDGETWADVVFPIPGDDSND